MWLPNTTQGVRAKHFQRIAENRCSTCGVDQLDEKRFGGLVQAGSAVAGPRRAVRRLEIGATGASGVLLGAGIPESSRHRSTTPPFLGAKFGANARGIGTLRPHRLRVFWGN